MLHVCLGSSQLQFHVLHTFFTASSWTLHTCLPISLPIWTRCDDPSYVSADPFITQCLSWQGESQPIILLPGFTLHESRVRCYILSYALQVFLIVGDQVTRWCQAYSIFAHVEPATHSNRRWRIFCNSVDINQLKFFQFGLSLMCKVMTVTSKLIDDSGELETKTKEAW